MAPAALTRWLPDAYAMAMGCGSMRVTKTAARSGPSDASHPAWRRTTAGRLSSTHRRVPPPRSWYRRFAWKLGHAGDDVEIRRITVINESDQPRDLRLASYGEVVLAPPLEDERHPAFSKLFVGSEYVPEMSGLLFTRRPRHPHERPPVLLHRVVSDDPGIELAGFDTDRGSSWAGGRSGRPRSMRSKGPLERPAGLSTRSCRCMCARPRTSRAAAVRVPDHGLGLAQIGPGAG